MRPRPGEDRRLTAPRAGGAGLRRPGAIPESAITGLVLAGGRGSRMGGADKGLLLHGGVPLAMHALRRLGPQVGTVAVNANRNAEAYAGFGAPVWPDRLPGRPGPLAGILTGLERCATPYLVTVPCDAPRFPTDLVRRLADALATTNADLAVAVTARDGVRRLQPVFCLVRTVLAPDLARFLEAGQRRVGAWVDRQHPAEVDFEAIDAFANLNTAEELRRSEAGE